MSTIRKMMEIHREDFLDIMRYFARTNMGDSSNTHPYYEHKVPEAIKALFKDYYGCEPLTQPQKAVEWPFHEEMLDLAWKLIQTKKSRPAFTLDMALFVATSELELEGRDSDSYRAILLQKAEEIRRKAQRGMTRKRKL